MSDKHASQEPLPGARAQKPKYEAPAIIDLSGSAKGASGDCEHGSSDAQHCRDSASASYSCWAGTVAAHYCETGSTAQWECFTGISPDL